MLNLTYFTFVYIFVFSVLINYVCPSKPVWYSYQFETQHSEREELIITSVESSGEVNTTSKVSCWKSITVNDKAYAIGFTSSNIVLITALINSDKSTFLTSVETININITVTTFELFKNWNPELHVEEAILVLAVYKENTNKLIWYNINSSSLNHFWTSNLANNISHMRYFKIKNKHNLLILGSNKYHPEGTIYEFQLKKNEFWLLQTLPLLSVAYNSGINNNNGIIYLSIPQENNIYIYKLENNHFIHVFNLTSANVSKLTSFDVGNKAFLAIDGAEAGIYTFTKSGIFPVSFNELNLENVNFWLAIPIKMYIDSVMLILQRTMDHGSHKTYYLESMVFNGNKFVHHEEVPCQFSGEREHGLNCLIDDEYTEKGLMGATSLAIGNSVGILVPRREVAVLFMIRSELKPLISRVNLNLNKLMEIKGKLEKSIEVQRLKIDNIQKDIENNVKPSIDSIVNLPAAAIQDNINISVPVSDNYVLETNLENISKAIKNVRSEMDIIKSKLSKSSNSTCTYYKQLLINGEIDVTKGLNINKLYANKLNNEFVDTILGDIVRKDNIEIISGHKTFTDLKIQNLTFDTVNEMASHRIIYNNKTPITIKGNFVFEKPFEVDEDLLVNNQINNYDNLLMEVVETNKKFEGILEFNHIFVKKELIDTNEDKILLTSSSTNVEYHTITDLELENIELPGNITVENLNGEDFESFKKSICFINVDTYIPGITYFDGNLVVDNADIKFLNDLKFPNDYLTKNSPSTVTGKKLFEKPIEVDNLIVKKTINDVRVDDIITLRTQQTLTGNYTFADLEITETFQVSVNLSKQLQDLENLLLNESKHLKANVKFNNLEVEGSIIVSDRLNGNKFEDILRDAVYVTEETSINSTKIFGKGISVINGLNVLTKSINSIPIESFVTTNTNQDLLLRTLNGKVAFENLFLTGLYGNTNITKLNKDVVKVQGEHSVSTLIFVNEGANVNDIVATNLTITNTLNNLTSTEYLYVVGNRQLETAINFEELSVENLMVKENIAGAFNNFSVEEFDKRRISVLGNQTIKAKYIVNNFFSEKFQTNFLNQELFEKYYDFQYYADTVSEKFYSGKLDIKDLIINGSLYINSINELTIKNLANYFIWKDKDNQLDNAIFENDVTFTNLNVKTFNTINFKTFIDNIIYKYEKNVTINSLKRFMNGIHITRMLNSERLNNIYVDDILTKTGVQQISSPLRIYGNIWINHNTVIDETLNEVPVKYLLDKYQFIGDTCIIKGDLVFKRLPYITNMIVDGHVNGIQLEYFLKNIVFKSGQIKLAKIIIFKNLVEITHNLIVTNKINGIDFSEFVQDIMYITVDNVIEVPITFVKTVHVEKVLTIDAGLETLTLMGIDVNKWIDIAVFINSGRIPGKLTFESVTVHENMHLNYINDISLSALIPLRSEQHINNTLELQHIMSNNDIIAHNYVNECNLKEKYQNTLLMNEVDYILKSNIVFTGNVVVNNLDMIGLVNGKNLSSLVTTDTAQNLTASYKFDTKLFLNKNMNVQGLVSNINITDWQRRSVKTQLSVPQVIGDNWIINGSVTFYENIEGRGEIKELNIDEIINNINEKYSMETYIENGLKRNFSRVCKDINNMIDLSQNQIYLFKYLEYFQFKYFDYEVANIHYFKVHGESYVLVTLAFGCISTLFVREEYEFRPITQIKSGTILQCIAVYEGDLLFLITRNEKEESNCSIIGTNVWKFHRSQFIHMLRLENHDILQESLVPGTFYGLRGNMITEYKLISSPTIQIKPLRRWKIYGEHFKFVPRGLATGLAVYTENELFKLEILDIDINNNYDYDVDIIYRGNVIEQPNTFLPHSFQKDNDILVINVGTKNTRRTLAVVTFQEETTVKNKLDFIKIYENIFTKKLLQKIPSYKPSSVISLEFGDHGETLLLFLENEQSLQVYQYRGVEGFTFRTSVNIKASKLYVIPESIMSNNKFKQKNFIGIVYRNEVTFLEIVMNGNQISSEQLNCEL